MGGFRGFQRFLEAFRGFQVFRIFFQVFQRPSQRVIFLSELRVLLPLIVLPLKTPAILARGWGQRLFSFQIPAVQRMARTSSLNCLSFRNPYQNPHSLNCLPPFHWKSLFSLKSASSHPLPKNRLWSSFFYFFAVFLEGPTRKPRHASVFSTHSDTQAVPRFHCIRMFKGIFSTRAFLKLRYALTRCLPMLKEASDTFSTH